MPTSPSHIRKGFGAAALIIFYMMDGYYIPRKLIYIESIFLRNKACTGLHISKLTDHLVEYSAYLWKQLCSNNVMLRNLSFTKYCVYLHNIYYDKNLLLLKHVLYVMSSVTICPGFSWDR